MSRKISVAKAASRKCRLAFLALSCASLAGGIAASARPPCQPVFPITDQAIEGRRAHLIALELAKPFPGLSADEPVLTYNLGNLNAALAGFEHVSATPGASANQAALANAQLENVLRGLKQQPTYKGIIPPHSAGVPSDDDSFHFEISQFLFRIYRSYGHARNPSASLLSRQNEQRIADIFYDWAKSDCRISDPASLETWRIWGSENHGAQRDSACWAASSLLSENPQYATKTYEDGSTPAAQLAAWTIFVRKYLDQRLRDGTLVEYFSPTYAQYTLTAFYLYADFSDDPDVRGLAKENLDLWWALWAQEQIDGIHGGSKTRNYLKTIPAGYLMQGPAWLYFGLGETPKILGPGEAAAVASRYRPPAVVSDIALDVAGRGSYEVITRAPGLAVGTLDPEHFYHVDSRHNGILRVARVTPGFVMGLAMVPLLPGKRWTAISSQNRWAGLVFAGGNPLARIVPSVVPPDGKSIYNALFGVQSGNVQVIRKEVDSVKKSGELRVWFGKPLKRWETNGWIVVDSSAYVAVRPTSGGWRWDLPQNQWMVPDDQNAAIVIQAAEKSEFPSLAAFINALPHVRIDVSEDAVKIVGLGVSSELSLGLGQNGLLKIGGRNVNFEPDFVLKSPFVTEVAGQDDIHMKLGCEESVLTFQ